jgi:hypothetical protein
MSLDQVKDALQQALQSHLAPSIIKDVMVFPETDSDGEPILRIQVVVDRAGPQLNADKVFFATGVARSALAQVKETRFPLLSFPSSDEVPGVAA